MTVSASIGPYRPLITLDARHDYFADRRCRHLSWKTCEGTRSLMDQLGLLLRWDGAGAAVYYDTQDTDALEFVASQGGGNDAVFLFIIHQRDPYFMNYTHLPGYAADAVYFLDSESAVQESKDNYRLHDSSHLSEQQAEPMDTLRGRFNLDRRDRGAPPLGIIRIRLAGGKGCPVGPKGDIRPIRFNLRFNNRSTYWKYIICGRLADQPVSIQDTSRHYTFSKPLEKAASDGGRVLSLMSDTPIPLLDRPAYTFQLKLNSQRTPRLLISRLPVAPVNMVHREVRGDENVYTSEIFIHS